MRFLYLLSLVVLMQANHAYASRCSDNFSDNELLQLKHQEFVITDDEMRQQVALKLVHCVEHSNPAIRDGVVYEAFHHWLRQAQLFPNTTQLLFEQLLTVLRSHEQDKQGFRKPFAALVLSEVVRVDRVTPYLNNQQRQQLVDTVTEYMTGIEDYRGFDDSQGWRHGVAHTADIMLQLALNKKVTKAQLSQLLDSIIKQVVPKSGHFYIYGEPRRLAMPVIYIALRGLHSQQEWQVWLDRLTKPAPMKSWADMYTSNLGLAKLHNSRSFFNSLIVMIAKSEHPNLARIKPLLEQAAEQVN